MIGAAQWGVQTVDGAGVSVTGLQVEFATATANAGSANGWFLAAKPSSVAGDDIYAFANFDDLTQLTINSGDVVRVTPKLRFHISAQA